MIRTITAAGVVSTLAGAVGSSGSADGTGASARFSSPEGVVVAGGIVYVDDFGNHTIRSITQSGAVTTAGGAAGAPGLVDGEAATARFNGPAGLGADSAGAIYVGDVLNGAVRVGVVGTAVGPVITVDPVSRAVGLHQSVQLTCDASGNPSPSFRWEFVATNGGSVALGETATFSGVNTRTLTINDAGRAQNGDPLPLCGDERRGHCQQRFGDRDGPGPHRGSGAPGLRRRSPRRRRLFEHHPAEASQRRLGRIRRAGMVGERRQAVGPDHQRRRKRRRSVHRGRERSRRRRRFQHARQRDSDVHGRRSRIQSHDSDHVRQRTARMRRRSASSTRRRTTRPGFRDRSRSPDGRSTTSTSITSRSGAILWPEKPRPCSTAAAPATARSSSRTRRSSRARGPTSRRCLGLRRPDARNAGWGYMLLTQGLWNRGNGTYTLYAFAFDKAGALFDARHEDDHGRQRQRDEAVRDHRHAGVRRHGVGRHHQLRLGADARIVVLDLESQRAGVDRLGPADAGRLRRRAVRCRGAFPGYTNAAAAGAHTRWTRRR